MLIIMWVMSENIIRLWLLLLLLLWINYIFFGCVFQSPPSYADRRVNRLRQLPRPGTLNRVDSHAFMKLWPPAVYIYIYIHEKSHLWRPLFWHILCWKSVFRLSETLHFNKHVVLWRETPLFKTSVPPRPYTCFQVYALFRYGETTLSACTC